MMEDSAPSEEQMRTQMFDTMAALERMASVVIEHFTADKQPPREETSRIVSERCSLCHRFQYRIDGHPIKGVVGECACKRKGTPKMTEIAVAESAADLEPGQPVPIHLWGRDHYSTFAYAECRLVDNKGTIDHRHMRGGHCGDDAGYPTRLAGGAELPDHGDYDCLFDAEDAGLLELGGTGLHPSIKRLTRKGALVAAALRSHKAEGGSFGNFSFQR